MPSAFWSLLAAGIPGAATGALLAGRFSTDPLRKFTLAWAALLRLILPFQGLRRIV
jgi:uncharacterized membrane protein YfcA